DEQGSGVRARHFGADGEESHVEHPAEAFGERPDAGRRLRDQARLDQGTGDGELSSQAPSVAAEVTTEQQKITAETREIDLVIDESKLLQAVVDTQEAERKRIARQVHDGPAQAMANVVLQSEISERLYEVDQQKSRAELASLRQMVNKTLQELRGFIFELRPMILDDL